MAQFQGYVNCPHCGKQITVYCPDIDKVPRKIKADKQHFWFQNESTHNEIACESCHGPVTLYWYY